MQEHIKKMAVEAGYHDLRSILTEREAAFHVAFAQAVARECAGVSEEIARRKEADGVFLWEARNCAQAIRARYGLEG